MTIPAETVETEDVYAGTVPTMEQSSHLLSHAPLISADSGITCFSRLKLLVHIVRRMAFNPQLADGYCQLVYHPLTHKPTPPSGGKFIAPLLTIPIVYYELYLEDGKFQNSSGSLQESLKEAHWADSYATASPAGVASG